MTTPDTIRIFVPLEYRRRNGRTQILPPKNRLDAEDRQQDPHILRALARAWEWRRKLETREVNTVSDLAAAESLPDFSGICSTDILPIQPGPKLDRRFLAYFLRQPHLVEMASAKSTGVNLPRLSPKSLAEFEVPFPALSEQQRIADLLDKVGQILSSSRKLKELGNDLLTVEFSARFPKGDYEPIEIGDLLEDGCLLLHKDGNHGSNYPRKSEFGTTGVPFLTAKTISDGSEIDENQLQFLSVTKAERLRIGRLQANDVLLAHNATVGPVCLYDGRYDEAIIGTSLTAFRCEPTKLWPEYLVAALRHTSFQNQLFAQMSQTTRNQVPITSQRRLRIAVPPIEKQKEFASVVRRISKQSKRINLRTAEAKMLFESLAQRAFCGEL
ncbi:MAG TPA: hypothetical protein DIT67_08980 [Octadecabacter sp.]|nr:hypothetical protein [Octadecabacter sp.]